ncbi:MAG: hypothetical protein OJF55_002187 [Rhodanobacteraceae bacterium]|nr:MAG: hypothetical protein OJF55_002187 [Rhodanobacteraceae bacterium]
MVNTVLLFVRAHSPGNAMPRHAPARTARRGSRLFTRGADHAMS